MSEHFCEYDHNLEEDCGRQSSICIFFKNGEKLWLCAEHYDEHAKRMAAAGLMPEGEIL